MSAPPAPTMWEFGHATLVLSATAILLLVLPPGAFAQRAPDVAKQILEADRLAWLTNWNDALPLYERAERDAIKAGNRHDALYAKFGHLRGRMQTLSLATSRRSSHAISKVPLPDVMRD